MLSEVSNLVKDCDIFCFVETWLTENDIRLYVEGFDYFRSDRIKNKRAKRGSGGVKCVFFINKDILPGVVKINSNNFDCIWVKMSKQFFNTARDIYICCCYYVPPSNSTAVSNDDNFIDVLQNEIAIYDQI